METADNFAEYILNENNMAMKMEIAYYMAKKTGIFFDKTVILKTEIARMFLDYMDIDVDKNLVLTASLLCNCKKNDNIQKLGKIETYAIEGAKYLKEFGFNDRFCKICEGFNRYSKSEPREKESDILELVEQFGGLIIDRPERESFLPEDALVIMKDKKINGRYNEYLDDFIVFIKDAEKVYVKDTTEITIIKKLIELFYKSSDVRSFSLEVANEYEIRVDKLLKLKKKQKIDEMLFEKLDSDRSLFSKEIASKIMNHEERILENTVVE